MEMKLSIKKDDQVQVIAGKDKGKTGKVMRVNRVDGTVIVEKLNMVTRHQRPSQKNPQGGLVSKEAPIHYSNILLFCEKCGKGVRHGMKESGKKAKASAAKIRICKKCKSEISQ